MTEVVRAEVLICNSDKKSAKQITSCTEDHSDSKPGLSRQKSLAQRSRSELIYDYWKLDDGTVDTKSFLEDLSKRGILPDDPRLSSILPQLESMESYPSKDDFVAAIQNGGKTIEQAFTNSFVLREFEQFSKHIQTMYRECVSNKEGKLCKTIPQLAKQNPDHFAVSVCTTDGQRFDVGQARVQFLIQSCIKPISYCMALEELGKEVHNHIGRENSGERSDVLKLMSDGLPHNPLNNSGAIMTGALIKQGLKPADRFDYYTKIWSELAGGFKLGFSNSAYLSERSSNDNIHALAHFMRESNAFPKDVNLDEAIEFYFQTYALRTNTNRLSIVAGSLANGGVCPLTGKKIFSPETVKNCLSMMYACGMYDYSGEFAFTVGLPACSGESGAIIIVIPNVMGVCTFSPLLDDYGNSTRGVDFCKRLTKHFNFHMFDNVKQPDTADKEDPRGSREHEKVTIEKVLKYTALGDLTALRRLQPSADVLVSDDYDRRTPLHVAATNGHLSVIEYILDMIDRKHVNPLDRWQRTPLDDALKELHDGIAECLRRFGGKTGDDIMNHAESGHHH